MLQIKELVKDYVQKDIETVHALRGVNVDFRKNEFVAILGPSGCGKTTFLNIIGGLDRYTKGDLLIKGKSTKQYKDKDWDTYRNHSIGFVFQSYNLIPHQTILQNVALALTISGIDKKEREERAKHALAKVGLSKMIHKKPNQMSGGQMQRVAIARALVNNPEILLADEPTGALDSVTSVQVMDLLKEVAKDRLVIMVTHNPDLAEKYATRIINMFDGQITGDSNPYKIKAHEYDEEIKEEQTKGKKYSQMKFFTAFKLSLSNLFSKLKRTILVAIAGSIGIIGVSSVLAVSQGIKNYIASMQDDMLSSYPLQIAEESVDYSALMSGLQAQEVAKDEGLRDSVKVGLDSMISYLMDKYKDFTSVKTNDINRNLLAYIDNAPKEAVAAKKYNYSIDVTNNIFTPFKKTDGGEEKMMSLNGITQMYISTLKTVEGFSEYAQFVDLFTDFMKQLPDNKDYVIGSGQYKMLNGKNTIGRYPENENEILIVVDAKKQTLTDILLAQLGMYPQDEFLNIAKRAIAENDETSEHYGKPSKDLETLYPYKTEFTIDELVGKTIKYYPHNDIYSYGDIEESFTNKLTVMFNLSGVQVPLAYDEETKQLEGSYNNMLELTFTKVNGSDTDTSLPVYATFEGTLMGSPVKFRIAHESSGDKIYDETKAPTDPSYLICEDDGVNKVVINEPFAQAKGYHYPAVAKEEWQHGVDLTISGIAIAGDDTQFGCLSRGIYYTDKFAEKYMNDALESEIVSNTSNGIIAHIGSGSELKSSFKAYVTFEYDSYKKDPDNATLEKGYALCLNADMNTSLSSMFSGFSGGMNYFEVDKIYLRSLSGLSVKKIDVSKEPTATSLLTKNGVGDEANIKYTFEKLPQSISIYPSSFAMKKVLTDYLDKWNESDDISINGNTLVKADRDELNYVDTIETIIAVITTLIDIVSVALIIFTSLSLVVSCFMIAVITYISVMERVKEIGIIRSLGGRKKDVNRLFTAENLITGLSSGLIGVLFTYLLQLIANLILRALTYPAIVALSIPTALIMIGISVLLSVISGAIPSRNASKQDPVVALRTE